MSEPPRKRTGETVAAFLRRSHPAVVSRVREFPGWVFSWWFGIVFFVILVVVPVGLAIVWTYPR